jgi:hypothetical protein
MHAFPDRLLKQATGSVLASNPLSLILAIYCSLTSLFTCALLGFHLFLIYQGKTTNEQLKTVYAHGNPYSRSGIFNCIDVFMNLPLRSRIKPYKLEQEDPVVVHTVPRGIASITVCMYVCMYACVYECMYVCMYV